MNDKKEIEDSLSESLGSGYCGSGNFYSMNNRTPLYMTRNLPVPKLILGNETNRPETSASYSSEYYSRGYGPSLKAVNIGGCDNCHIDRFRSIS
jgi:hypothetical protein